MSRRAAESRLLLSYIIRRVEGREKHPVSDHDGWRLDECTAFRAGVNCRRFLLFNCSVPQLPIGTLGAQPPTHTTSNSRGDVLDCAHDMVGVTGRQFLISPLQQKFALPLDVLGNLHGMSSPQHDLCGGD